MWCKFYYSIMEYFSLGAHPPVPPPVQQYRGTSPVLAACAAVQRHLACGSLLCSSTGASRKCQLYSSGLNPSPVQASTSPAWVYMSYITARGLNLYGAQHTASIGQFSSWNCRPGPDYKASNCKNPADWPYFANKNTVLYVAIRGYQWRLSMVHLLILFNIARCMNHWSVYHWSP